MLEGMAFLVGQLDAIHSGVAHGSLLPLLSVWRARYRILGQTCDNTVDALLGFPFVGLACNSIKILSIDSNR